MATLYPVIVENSIPAFGKSSVKIPFQLNRGNTISEVGEVSITIKTSLDRVLKTDLKTKSLIDKTSRGATAVLGLSDISGIKEGNFYKFQLKIVDKNDSSNTSQNSTVTIGKCISLPTIEIEGAEDSGKIYTTNDSYTGKVSFEIEKGTASSAIDKPRQYCFSVIDNQQNVIDTTGWKYHSFEQDDLTNFIFFDQYVPEVNLKKSDVYSLKYEVITENQYYTSTLIKITAPVLYDMEQEEFGLKLTAAADNENGCVDLEVTALDSEKVQSGEYIIRRFDEQAGWRDLFRFSLAGNINPKIIKRDWWIEQGVGYLYSLQKINQYGIRTEHFVTDEGVICNFEDMFLLDTDHSLRIQFSPTMSSFKTNVLESKIETIGSKFPFFFRNGNVNYKEFPIGGKISYLMDKDFLFMDNESLDLINEEVERPASINMAKVPTTNLTHENIKRERSFKLSVLDWLNNGKPKLFKSPTEGNYVVKLMNVSLSPENTLGRMIHSFSSTAYEIADNDYENLKDLNLLSTSLNVTSEIPESTIYQSKILTAAADTNVLDCNVTYFKITDAVAGTELNLQFEDDSITTIVIGSTGQYETPVLDERIVSMTVTVPEGSENTFCATLFYHGAPKAEETEFDKIKEISSQYLFKTISGEEASENTLFTILGATEQETVTILKIKFYIENYDLVDDTNSKIEISTATGSASIDIAASDLLELNSDTFEEITEVKYPANCIVATECYYRKDAQII